MQIRYHCPTDRCVAIIEYEPLETCGKEMECPRCHVRHPMGISETLRESGRVDRCVVCGATELFVRKDFPQRVGLAVVLLFGGVAIYWFWHSELLTAWAALAVAVLIDLVIYALIGTVTSCYACRAEYRGCTSHAGHEGFDLATSEKY